MTCADAAAAFHRAAARRALRVLSLMVGLESLLILLLPDPHSPPADRASVVLLCLGLLAALWLLSWVRALWHWDEPDRSTRRDR